MIQDLISQDLNSDSESEEEISISCRAPHNANTSHHLHPDIAQDQVVKLEQGQAIIDDDVEITAGQRDDTGNPNDDEIETRGAGNLNDDAGETRDSVNNVLSDINDPDKIEGTEPSYLNDNEKEVESSGINRSPYKLGSRKK